MTIEMAIDIINHLLTTTLAILSPILMAIMVVGVGVSLLQTVSSIQEQTLSFVPKLLVVGVLLIVSANWMLRTMVEFCAHCINRMPDLAL